MRSLARTAVLRTTVLFAFLVAGTAPAARAAGPKTVDRTWKIDGADRTGTIVLPADDAAAASATTKAAAGRPAVFVFHGHGGSAAQARRSFAMDAAWPGAVVVYLQGLPVSGILVDKDGKLPGWDMRTAVADNRDVRFFDAVLKTLTAEYRVDPKRVYATGHSNGGGFVYVLWSARADALAAVAPSAAVPPRGMMPKAPKPALLVAGRQDTLVKFAWQEAGLAAVRKLDGCAAGDGKPWGKDATRYEAAGNPPVVALIHDGGHPPPADVGARVAAFFKEIDAK